MILSDLNILLELQNGAWSILGAFLLFALVQYLIVETRVRGISWRRVLKNLPVSMQLAVGIGVLVVGVTMRSVGVAAWRASGGGPMANAYTVALAVGAAIACVGMLCLIRVITRPRYGHRLWLASVCVVVAYVMATLGVRAMG